MARRAPPSTRSDLLRAAQGCFAERGFEATKVEDITLRAGIAKGAFYSYFVSKEQCWQQIVEAFLLRLGAAVQRPASASERGVPPSRRLETWLAQDVTLLEFCWENRVLLGMLMNGAGGAGYAHLLDEFAARAAEDAEVRIRELVAEGLYRADVDPKLVASLVAGAYDRLVRELMKQPERPAIESLARQTQRLFVRGLLSEPARARLQAVPSVATRRADAARVARAQVVRVGKRR
ncbi:MAG: TetR/AcrR family transcriptional regulator [Polyangiales bacterium]